VRVTGKARQHLQGFLSRHSRAENSGEKVGHGSGGMSPLRAAQ